MCRYGTPPTAIQLYVLVLDLHTSSMILSVLLLRPSTSSTALLPVLYIGDLHVLELYLIRMYLGVHVATGSTCRYSTAALPDYQ